MRKQNLRKVKWGGWTQRWRADETSNEFSG